MHKHFGISYCNNILHISLLIGKFADTSSLKVLTTALILASQQVLNSRHPLISKSSSANLLNVIINTNQDVAASLSALLSLPPAIYAWRTASAAVCAFSAALSKRLRLRAARNSSQVSGVSASGGG